MVKSIHIYKCYKKLTFIFCYRLFMFLSPCRIALPLSSRGVDNVLDEMAEDTLSTYSVMQSDGNSLKIDTFREAIASELSISS